MMGVGRPDRVLELVRERVKLFLWAKVVYTTMFLSDMFSLDVCQTHDGEDMVTVLGVTWTETLGTC